MGPLFQADVNRGAIGTATRVARVRPKLASGMGSSVAKVTLLTRPTAAWHACFGVAIGGDVTFSHIWQNKIAMPPACNGRVLPEPQTALAAVIAAIHTETGLRV